MYKDIISYELAEGVSESHLLKIGGEIVETWMRNLPGFIRWEIHKNKDGHYSDIVYWKSEENAKHAEAEMANIPNASEWYGCYKEGTISSKNLTLVRGFE